MATKLCARCRLPVDIALFKPDLKSRDGLKSWCQPCFKQYDHERCLRRYKTRKPGRPQKQVVDGKLLCSTCRTEKLATNEFFAKDCTTPTGFNARCKVCCSENAKRYHQEHKQQRVDAAHAWNQVNPDKHAAANLRWVNKSPQNKLSVRLRSRLSDALRTHIRYKYGLRAKGASAVRDLGCTIDELMVHLEQQFQSGMTWDNYGEWEIDHVKPLSSFDLTNEEQCKQAVHYTNLQPLWASDNARKGDKPWYN